MHFSRFPLATAGLIGAAQALVPSLVGESNKAPAAFDCGSSWDDEVLFEGIVSPETETSAAVHLGLNLKEAQVEGNIAIEALEDFLVEPNLRLDLAGVKAYIELDLSASAAVFQTVELVVSPELEIDAGFLEVALGTAFALDLVVGVDAAVDLSAGFYVSFNSGDYIDLSVVTKEVVDSCLDGLVTKALPVGVGAEVDLSAGIEVQLGLRLRSHVKLEAGLDLLGLDLLDVGAEVAIWADLLTHTIALVETDNCVVAVDSHFALALGIAVDLSVDVLDLLDISLAPKVLVTLATAVGVEVCLDNRGVIGDYLEIGDGSDDDKSSIPTITGAPNATATDGALITRTVSNTKTFTVTACAAGAVHNCPADQTQKVVTSTVVSSVTVCPADQTDAPEEPTSTSTTPKKVHTVTDTLTTVVPCKPTSSTFTAPSTKPAAPTVTISDSTSICPTATGGDNIPPPPPQETGSDNYQPPAPPAENPGEGDDGDNDYTPPAPAPVPGPTETPGEGGDYTPPAPPAVEPPTAPTAPVVPPPVASPPVVVPPPVVPAPAPPAGGNQTASWTSSVVAPTGPVYTPPPPPATPSPIPPPTAGAETVKIGMVMLIPALAMML